MHGRTVQQIGLEDDEPLRGALEHLGAVDGAVAVCEEHELVQHGLALHRWQRLQGADRAQTQRHLSPSLSRAINTHTQAGRMAGWRADLPWQAVKGVDPHVRRVLAGVNRHSLRETRKLHCTQIMLVSHQIDLCLLRCGCGCRGLHLRNTCRLDGDLGFAWFRASRGLSADRVQQLQERGPDRRQTLLHLNLGRHGLLRLCADSAPVHAQIYNHT